MPEGLWVFAVIVPTLVAAFSYLLKLFDTADAVRQKILACNMWSEESHPRSVAEIEGNRDWALVVGGYYSMVERIYRSIGLYSSASIAILVSAILVIAFHDQLQAVRLRGDSTMLIVVQTALFAISMLYAGWVISIVNDKSWLKGQVEMAIQRLANVQEVREKEKPKADSLHVTLTHRLR
jgi:uncharacterized membrane protein (DUF485 family)